MQQLWVGFGRSEPNPIQIGANRDWKAISCGQGYHTRCRSYPRLMPCTDR
ncbi:MAG: hypothetical protein JWM99_793 [Verrucomicrobiales bacterium]|nr:hypothetical protein [Verrucomicrobiales bacterium]